jgi:signal transduction histidine kinase
MWKPALRAEPGSGDRGEPSVVSRALRRFVTAMLIAMVVLALGTLAMSRRIAHEEAVRDARVTAGAIARNLVAPQLHRDRGDVSAADSTMGPLLEHRLRDGSITHMKVWSPTGRVIWADQEALVGKVYALPREVKALFGTTESVVELSDSKKPERGEGEERGDLLEVYVGGRDASGRPFVFESYTSTERVSGNTQVILLEVAPIGLAALLLFALITLPLAISLAKDVDRAQRRRTEMLRYALAAWGRERRRIAQEIHDDVIQDLAAVGYGLHGVISELPPSALHARAMGEGLATTMVRVTSSLRDVVGDLAVRGPADGDLNAGISDLVERAENHGLRVQLDLDPSAQWDPEVARIVYWVVREGLRNAIKHAQAETATITVHSADGRVDVRVSDDGRGRAGSPADGDPHVGLDLLAHALEDAGGRLVAEGGPDGGFVLSASMPRRLDD